jgi:predicted nucleic acid-binding protein
LIVIDASAVLEVILHTEAGSEIEERILAPRETLHAPHLIDQEIAQVLRRYCAAGDMGPERGLEALTDFVDLPITRYPQDIFLPRIWALRHNLTAYDTAYVALAEGLFAPLLTRDMHLALAPGHSAIIEWV